MRIIYGFTWIEILICLALLSMLLLGIDATQLQLLIAAHRADELAIATQQLAILNERLVALGSKNSTVILANWNLENEKLLPAAKGRLVGSFPDYEITLCWGSKPKCLALTPKDELKH